MKVARLYSFEDIRIEDHPIPEVGPGEALVKTKACGICSGDVMRWYIEKKAPLVIGHEPAGEIIETGRKVSYFEPGDRVFVHHHAPCFTCSCCRRGDYVQCSTWRESRIIPGGVSEYILVPEVNLENDTLKLPEQVSWEAATLIEPTACVIKSLKRARVRPGDTVLVIGLGVMGLLHIIMARKMGADMIIGADMVDFRLARAVDVGADHAVNVTHKSLPDAVKDITGGRMAQIVVVGPNSAEAMAEGISCTGAGGTVLFFTPARPGETITIDPNELYFRDINLVTSYSCGPTDTADALELLEAGIIPVDRLITHRFMIDDTGRAFRLTAEAGNSIKSIIVFD